MNTQLFESVWSAIEGDAAEAKRLGLCAQLMRALSARIAKAGLNQAEAATLLGVSQPRVSDLVRGKIDSFSLDALVLMSAKAGLHVKMKLQASA